MVIYSYCISASPSASCAAPSGGYDPVGNVVSYYDSVNGTWSMAGGYDNLNRLTAASSPTGAGGPYAGLQVSWSYDDFGNRTAESLSGNDQGNAPVPASASAGYNASNQMQSVGSGVAPTYDAAGNVLTDPQGQQYLYDAEGRVCAVNGLGGLIGYLYDAEGDRVAKGTLSSFSCNAASNGFQMTASYVLGPSGEQLTEVDWSGGALSNWHTNVWAAGELVGTYSPNFDPSQTAAGVLNFYLDDWLGTRRVMTDALGNGQESCNSLPYGDGETCAPVPTEHLFTGKERDAESGNDYFGARYYASSMGRFLSPDPSQLDYADQTNPQSLNLYSYAWNNPLRNVDPTGMYCFYGGQGDTPENDSDPTDYDFGATSSSDCGSGGQWIDNPSTTVNVNGDTGESDSISTFPTDTNTTIQRSFTRQLPCNQSASSTVGNLENNFPQNADWQNGPLHVTFLQRGQLQQGGVIPIDGLVGAWAANGSPAGIMHMGTSEVSVTSVGSNSFTFTTVPGMHPFDNGTVTFSATGAGSSNINFSVDVDAEFADKASQLAFKYGGGSQIEASIWHNLINNVQGGCHN